MEINYNSGISLAQKVNTLLNFLQDRNRKHVQTNADIGNLYGKILINFVLVIVYVICFGYESFRRFSKNEIIITKELQNQESINPPGKSNMYIVRCLTY